jgi:flavin reductase (DIM6/NTAB) family NADH-FMN oxidoreductase RutF
MSTMADAAAANIASIDDAAMRALRRRWASGVALVLARDSDGDGDGFRGATVAALSFVSLAPPLVLVCLETEARTTALAIATGAFAVSILDGRHELTADRFAGRGPQVDAALSGVPHTLAPSGLPVLAGALAWLDCRVTAVHPGGDHRIIVAAVVAADLGPAADDPLLFFDGRYRALDPA